MGLTHFWVKGHYAWNPTLSNFFERHMVEYKRHIWSCEHICLSRALYHSILTQEKFGWTSGTGVLATGSLSCHDVLAVDAKWKLPTTLTTIASENEHLKTCPNLSFIFILVKCLLLVELKKDLLPISIMKDFFEYVENFLICCSLLYCLYYERQNQKLPWMLCTDTWHQMRSVHVQEWKSHKSFLGMKMKVF